VFLVFVTPLALPDGVYYEGFLPAVLNAFEPNPLNPNPFFINSMDSSTGIRGQSFEWIQLKLYPPLLQIPKILLVGGSGHFLFE
jgi:hypothetical protein